MSIRYTCFAGLLLALLLALLAGCSGSDNPVNPPTDFTDRTENNSAANTRMWGLWDITINADTKTAEVFPLRAAEFTANVTQFLQPPISKTHLMGIEIDPSSDFPNGYIVVDVILNHPFPGLDMYTGFDVRGVCIGNGSVPGISDTNLLYAGPEDLHVLNPDGLTRWFNPSEFTSYETILGFTRGKLGVPSTDFTATLNGYKYFCDNLEAEDDLSGFFANPSCPNPRGMFTAGNTNRRTYELQFPVIQGEPFLSFQYAVIASWENPDPVPPMDIPGDFPISANCYEAFCYSTADESDMYYTDSSSGGTLKLDLRVFAHMEDGSPDPVSSRISQIHLETQTGLITGNLATFDTTALQAAIGSEDNKSVIYNLEFAGVNPSESGDFPLLVVVECSDPDSYDPGFPGFAFPDGVLAGYYLTTVHVSDLGPPVVDSIDPAEGDIDDTLTDVEVSGSNFDSGAQVTLVKNDDPGVVVEATNEVVTGSTLITCDLDLDSGAGAVVGTYHVVVENPDLTSGQLDDGFDVLVGYPYWWENNQYVSSRGSYNPTATIDDPENLTLKYQVSAPQSYKYCTPVVAEDKIFFTSHTAFYANTNVRVYGYDLETGSQLWNAQINPSNVYERYQPGFGFYKGDDGVERLIVGGDQIYCFDADSTGTNPAPLWTYDDTVPGNNNWLGTNLVVYEDMVIARGRDYRILYILDITNGTVIHRVDTIMSGYESGVSAFDGKAYSNGSTYVDCVDIEAGTVDWSTQVPSGLSVSHYGPPCASDGRIYFGSYAGYVQCYAIEDDGTYSAGDFIWSVPTPDYNPVNGGVAKLDDYMYCAAAFYDSHVYCIKDNGDTGSVEWTSALGYYDAQMTICTTPSYPDGVIIAPQYNANRIYFLDATDGSVIRVIDDGQTHRGGAACVGDYVILAGRNNLSVYE